MRFRPTANLLIKIIMLEMYQTGDDLIFATRVGCGLGALYTRRLIAAARLHLYPALSRVDCTCIRPIRLIGVFCIIHGSAHFRPSTILSHTYTTSGRFGVNTLKRIMGGQREIHCDKGIHPATKAD